MTPVDPLVVAVLVVLAALVGIVAGFIGARVQDRFRLTKSQTDAKDIVARAEKEANNLRKEAELKTKDEFFKKREEFNREIEKDRQEVREQERFTSFAGQAIRAFRRGVLVTNLSCQMTGNLLQCFFGVR